jgi:hypothetical protein
MSSRQEYQVLATRFGDWWHIEVPGLGVHAESRVFLQVDAVARHAISMASGVDVDSFDVAIDLCPALEDVLRVKG